MRKTRTDFQEDRNERFFKAHDEGGLSYTDIALNPNYNPGRLTPQRIHQIVKDWEQRFPKGKQHG